MESFTFLKYWRGGANDRAADNAALTTIVTAPQETDEGESDGDDGPFFDLEFALPDEPGQTEPGSTGTESDSGEGEEEEEVTVPVSPSEELFFKGELVPVETGIELDPEPNAKSQLSRLKSAANFRVLMLKLKKNKEEKKGEEKEEKVKKGESKFFTVKFKIEEIPIKSVFKRDNSSRSRTGTNKPGCRDETGTEEKKVVSKDVMQRYLKMVRLPKRHGGEAAAAKRLGKSRSATAAAEVAPSCGEVATRRRDDSLVQQQDGIQSAILHCKNSFNASRDLEFSMLSRSVSDPSHDFKSTNAPSMKNCSDEPIENRL